jgi:hypothetical protein
MTLRSKVLYESDLFLTGTTTNILGFVLCQTTAQALSIAGVTNDPPTAEDPNTSFPIRVTGTKKFGITARHIVIGRLAGASPNQYREYRRIPIFTSVYFDNALSEFAASVEYESLTDWFIVGGIAERYRLNLSAS